MILDPQDEGQFDVDWRVEVDQLEMREAEERGGSSDEYCQEQDLSQLELEQSPNTKRKAPVRSRRYEKGGVIGDAILTRPRSHTHNTNSPVRPLTRGVRNQGLAQLVKDQLSEDESNQLPQKEKEQASLFEPQIEQVLWRRHQTQLEYLVKRKGRSYLHVEWISEAKLADSSRLSKCKFNRFNKTFDRKLADRESEQDDVSFYDPSYMQPDRIISASELFPVVHQKKSQEARANWIEGLVLVLSKLINLTHQQVHYGLLLKELVSVYDPSITDFNTFLNRVYLEYYKTPLEFWADLGESLDKSANVAPNSECNLMVVLQSIAKACQILYKQWHNISCQAYNYLLAKKLRSELQAESLQNRQQLQASLLTAEKIVQESNSQPNILIESLKDVEIQNIEPYNPGPYDLSWLKINPADLAQPLLQFLDINKQTQKLYLVKWKNLSYMQATWETQKDIDNPLKINQFKVFCRSLDKETRALLVSQYKRHFTLNDIQNNPKKSSRYGAAQINQLRTKLFFYDVSTRREPIKYTQTNQPIFKEFKRLRSYQLQSLNWLIDSWYSNRNVILADEMGLGKTIQSVAFLNHLYNFQGCKGPFLVIAPLSTLDHWKRTVEQWTSLNCVYYYDQEGQQGRSKIREYEWYYTDITTKGSVLSNHELHKFHVLVTSYEVFLQDFVRVFQFIPFQFVVVDEAHRLKNQNAKILASLKNLCCRRVILLTGTPVQNNTSQLWSLLNYIEPRYFPSIEHFRSKFGDLTTASEIDFLNETLKPYMLRRKKEDVERSIPPLQQTIVDIEMTNVQKTIYRALYQRNKNMLMKGMSSSSINATLNNLQIQLRKCCNHPFLIKEIQIQLVKGLGSQQRLQKLIESSGKMILVQKLLQKYKREGKKVLIFSQFTNMLHILQQLLYHMSLKFERIDGQIKARDRQNAIDRFNNKDISRDVFLLSTKAGGIGINLTSANVVIIYDSDWNPQNDIQATARAHRIGQQNQVVVYRLITKKTYQAQMFERATKKLGLDQAIFMGGVYKSHEANEQNDQMSKAKLSKNQIEILLKKGILGLIEEEGSKQNKFFQGNIQEILESNSRIAKYSLINGSYSFSKSQFVAQKTDVSINIQDPDFWKKVLKNIDSKSQILLKDYESGVYSTADKQKLLLHQISLCVNDLIQSKLSPTGFSAQDEKCLSQMLSKIECDKSFHHALRNLSANWLYQVMRPSRRFRPMTLQDIQNHLHRPVLDNKQEKGDVFIDSQNQNPLPDKDISKLQELLKKLCAVCQQAKSSVHCNKYCKRGWHQACLNSIQGQKKAAAIQLSLQNDQLKYMIEQRECEQCQQNQVQCFVCKKSGRYFGSEYVKNKKSNVIKIKKREQEEQELEVEESLRKNQVTKCSTANCNRFYHYDCIKSLDNQHLFKYIDNRSFHFRCSLHYCAKCSESGQTMTILQCIRCPRSLHLRCMEKDRVIKLNKKYFICERHRAVPQKEKKTLNKYYQSRPRSSNRRLLNEDYKQLKYDKKTRERRQQASPRKHKSKIQLTYEDIGIPSPAEFDYSTYDRDWCRYCGARMHSNFTKGPWGPKTLCTVHYLQWTKRKSLNLSDYKQRPQRPINIECREQLRYLSDLKSKDEDFDPRTYFESGSEEYRRRMKRGQ